MPRSSLFVAAALLAHGVSVYGFSSPTSHRLSVCRRGSNDDNDLDELLTSRLPTSVDDQVRQAAASIERASKNGNIHRHSIRLLLPVIGATELDDWPGGARQMMQAAQPLVTDIMKRLGAQDFSTTLLDASDGVYALLGQAKQARDDSCAVLLPSADTIELIQSLEDQVGPKRNLVLVNAQWKRVADFGGALSYFGKNNNQQKVDFAEAYHPTFSLTNLICEGESIRILRNYPGPWRVFVRKELPSGDVDWDEIGQKEFDEKKSTEWNTDPLNKRDGGRIFDYGLPSYQYVAKMLQSAPNYTPKNPAERAAAAFSFIKDSL